MGLGLDSDNIGVWVRHKHMEGIGLEVGGLDTDEETVRLRVGG